MKPKMLPILEMCVENGVESGLARAYKHDDDPSTQTIKENVVREVMNQIYEWFDMEDRFE